MMNEELIEQLKRHEGFAQLPYKDTLGNWTLGYGHNLHVTPITEEAAAFILIDDLKSTVEAVDKHLPWVKSLDDARSDVIYNMAFNLGVAGLLKWENFLEAVRNQRYHIAGDIMLTSKWKAQVKGRATELATQMKTGIR